MGSSYCLNYQHIVFHTGKKHLQPDNVKAMHAYIAGLLRKLQVHEISVGAVVDHVHILGNIGLKPIPVVVRYCKIAATRWLKMRNGDYYSDFHWQSKYGSFSVSPRHVLKVKQYVMNQASHHAMCSSNDEFTEMIKNASLFLGKEFKSTSGAR